MIYVECPLVDNGFYVYAIEGPGEIWGLDNINDEYGDRRFAALPPTGYPEGAVMCLDAPLDKQGRKTKTLAILPDGAALPEGGTEILAVDVVAMLVSEYGWPEGTTLVEGLPVAPRLER